jgi:hypothetical protein
MIRKIGECPYCKSVVAGDFYADRAAFDPANNCPHVVAIVAITGEESRFGWSLPDVYKGLGMDGERYINALSESEKGWKHEPRETFEFRKLSLGDGKKAFALFAQDRPKFLAGFPAAVEKWKKADE